MAAHMHSQGGTRPAPDKKYFSQFQEDSSQLPLLMSAFTAVTIQSYDMAGAFWLCSC